MGAIFLKFANIRQNIELKLRLIKQVGVAENLVWSPVFMLFLRLSIVVSHVQ